MSGSDELITRLRAAGAPVAGPDGVGGDDAPAAGGLGAAIDPERVVAIAGRRRARRNAITSSVAAIVVVGGAVGVGSQVLRGQGAAQSANAGAAPEAATAGAAQGRADVESRPGAAADSAGVLACPSSVSVSAGEGVEEPQRPGQLVGLPAWRGETASAAALVPSGVPRRVVACRYAPAPAGVAWAPVGGSTTSGEAADRLRLEGTVAVARPERAARDLAATVPADVSACRAAGGAATPYLVGLDYGSGRVAWLGVVQASGCSSVTNGAFVGGGVPADQVARAYDTGRWP